ncbi:MAG: DUF427 domain-containing protein [Planctomycetota bacterium]
MSHPKPMKPGPGQESVWDYPRPPRLEPVPDSIRIEFAGREVMRTDRAWRVLETSHPPTYYLPPDDFAEGVLRPVVGALSFCEWKGRAAYFDVVVGEDVADRAAWSYPQPTAGFAPIADHVCVYCHAMDACWVGDDRAAPQPGNFYGGWVTPRVVGPFKGEPGTMHW